ncbi:MAG TPA: hypothetical protein VH497_16745, partial [Vicinamibacterales bacterium]
EKGTPECAGVPSSISTLPSRILNQIVVQHELRARYRKEVVLALVSLFSLVFPLFPPVSEESRL